MLKQLKVFHNLISELKQDDTVEGVLLCGSVATGNATVLSDLDVIVLGQRDDFASQTIDGILVEIHYITFNRAIQKLQSNPMEVYKYLDAKIEFDNGKVQEIIRFAENVFENYHVSEKYLLEIAYWLRSTKRKLESAFSKQDVLLISYLASTNTWKVLEGIWSVNQQPMPPSGSLYRRYTGLQCVPCPDWFEKLLTGGEEYRGRVMIEYIDWILKRLDK